MKRPEQEDYTQKGERYRWIAIHIGRKINRYTYIERDIDG